MKVSIKTIVFLGLTILLSACAHLDKDLTYTPPDFEPVSHEFYLDKDIEWAVVKDIKLKMDIYVPDTGDRPHPVLVIYHGGGWLMNSKSIMNDLSAYIASHSDFIVCNADYRLLADSKNTTTMNEIIEDAMGSLIWVNENIERWNGDPDRIAITGDSAGGHLASMVLLGSDMLREERFSGTNPGFKPTYIPNGYTLERCMEEKLLEVQAAVISYGAFDIKKLAENTLETQYNIFWRLGGVNPRGIFLGPINVKNSPQYYEAVSPAYNIPDGEYRKLPPQLFLAGSRDTTVPPDTVMEYVNLMSEAGQDVLYWEHKGRPHAFLDSGTNMFLGISFKKDGIPAADVMIAYLNQVM